MWSMCTLEVNFLQIFLSAVKSCILSNASFFISKVIFQVFNFTFNLLILHDLFCWRFFVFFFFHLHQPLIYIPRVVLSVLAARAARSSGPWCAGCTTWAPVACAAHLPHLPPRSLRAWWPLALRAASPLWLTRRATTWDGKTRPQEQIFLPLNCSPEKQQLSFWGFKSYTWIFNCTHGWLGGAWAGTTNPHVANGSTVYENNLIHGKAKIPSTKILLPSGGILYHGCYYKTFQSLGYTGTA